MNLKVILLALLDAAEKAFPKWAGLFEFLRPFLSENAPADDGVIKVGAAPPEVIDAVKQFLNDLIAKADRPFVKMGLRVLLSLTDYLVSLAWDQLFPSLPRPVMARVTPNIAAVIAEAEAPV